LPHNFSISNKRHGGAFPWQRNSKDWRRFVIKDGGIWRTNKTRSIFLLLSAAVAATAAADKRKKAHGRCNWLKGRTEAASRRQGGAGRGGRLADFNASVD